VTEEQRTDVAPLIEAMADWQDAQRAAERAGDAAAVARAAAEQAGRLAQAAQDAAEAAREALVAAQRSAEAASAAAEDAHTHRETTRAEMSRTADLAASTSDVEQAAGERFRDELLRRDEGGPGSTRGT
jgi:hypothetical protein